MTLIQRFTANTKGRDYIVGDIHGHHTKLLAALERVRFSSDVDRLFCLGDLVDRGPDSAAVLDLLAHSDWMHSVRGNHEQMLIDYHAGQVASGMWALNGGAWGVAMTPAERQPLVDLAESLPLAIELETPAGLVVLVHANLGSANWAPVAAALRDPGSLPDDVLAGLQIALLWDRSRFDDRNETPVSDVLAVCVGHTPVPQRLVLGNTVFMDQGAWLPRNEAQPLELVNALALATVRA